MKLVFSARVLSTEPSSWHIDPLDESCIQPASVDLRLGREIATFLPREEYSFVDLRSDLTGLTVREEIPDPHPFILRPGQFVLGTTLEHVELPDDIVARLEGKSSLGRLGLLIHSTAGYVDPGWKGQLTLEITNVAPVQITLYFGMKIGQISFLRLSTPADRPYGTSGLGS
ncbi:MAG: dCTP deaminase, partial [Planctomycetes bacterium]|nr:dCTP deaminase [Planctomycetota bacterium]